MNDNQPEGIRLYNLIKFIGYGLIVLGIILLLGFYQRINESNTDFESIIIIGITLSPIKFSLNMILYGFISVLVGNALTHISKTEYNTRLSNYYLREIHLDNKGKK